MICMMMKRKLVKQGAATMMISLPSKWVKENKLEKGSEVEVLEEGNCIKILSKGKEDFVQKSKLNIDRLAPLVNRTIMAEYIKGIDELEVNFSEKGAARKLQKEILNELLGFEIVKQSNNYLLIKDITGTEKRGIFEFVNRIFLILDSMAEELIMAIEKKEDFDTVIEIDNSVNKFSNYCLRILNKYGYEDHSKTSQMYGIILLLEEIGDLYKDLASELKNSKIKKEQMEIIKELRTFLNTFKTAISVYNRETALDLTRKYESIKRKLGESEVDFCLSRLNDEMIKISGHLLVMNSL